MPRSPPLPVLRHCALAGDLTRAERKNLRVVYRSYYPTPGLMAVLWSDALRRATSGVLWTVMQARLLLSLVQLPSCSQVLRYDGLICV